MTGWMLDTNVLSELRRPRPAQKVIAFIRGLPLSQLFVSEVTFAEIRFGIEQLGDLKRRAEIRLWLQNQLRPMFQNRVLPISEDVLVQWRLIIEQGRKAGHTFSHPDVLIAATAAHNGLSVVTRDTTDFLAAGIKTINPWQS
ncbi:type II toxin-antitoxin system VapC family toxin [Thiorhodovibrio frisius]|uniref:Ribonuclease VapC n=1 Tax=Thiorhodovibrio frisius TaxID=631362 RepID=H8Z6B2_9GAMM|nr:type II toxin-antitoxin system VapC family toxin [Thiorhodovibrio frisius]EIC20696.1 putative nucleic acid-binding protein [Thiorhodovibrio frisius]WPL21444.1 putative ribonuclease FitB [Thiorhodovibrio frisius]